MRRAALSFVAVLVCACGATAPYGPRGTGGTDAVPGDGGTGGGGGTGGTGGGGTGGDPGTPSAIGGPIRLLAAEGLTGHALALYNGEVEAVATRQPVGGGNAEILWVRLRGAGDVSEPTRILPYPDLQRPRLSVGTLAIAGGFALLGLSNEDTVVALELDARLAALQAGNADHSGTPDRPFRPSAAPLGAGILLAFNGWPDAATELHAHDTTLGYNLLGHAFDPFVAAGGGTTWIGWNDGSGIVVSPVQDGSPPRVSRAITLGEAANGPVLAVGTNRALALTWGDAIVAHVLSLFPPALVATSAVANGPFVGRPTALPWDDGWLLLWMDPSVPAIRGRLLDAIGSPLGPPNGFVVVPLGGGSFAPSYAVGDANGAWVSWETGDGLYAASLARSTH